MCAKCSFPSEKDHVSASFCWSRNKSARPEASENINSHRPKPKGTARHNKEYLIFSCGKKR